MKSFTERPTVDSAKWKSEGGRFSLSRLLTLRIVAFSIAATTKWEIANPTHLSGISGIDFFDILSDGVPDLIVAREDGTVQVFNFESMEEPILKYTYVKSNRDKLEKILFFLFVFEQNGNESITNIEGGTIGNANYSELVCCTYQGNRTFDRRAFCIRKIQVGCSV